MQALEAKPKIAVYYPAFLGGGAEAVALWMLEALWQKYDLTLFTVSHVDLERLNTLYGTHLSNHNIQIKSLFPKSLATTINLLIANGQHARMLFFHLLIRYLKSCKDHYQLLISAYNAVDFGKQGLQYIHWTKVLEGNILYESISDFSLDRVKHNYSVANSQMVADLAKTVYGCEPTVLYPPVVIQNPNINWNDKENSFVCSGRLTKAKQTHKVIRILKQVRDRGFDIKLYLTGGGGGTYAWGYHRYIKQLVKENASWITLYENLAYEDYVQIISQCKYGIHYKKEPFGISIAEMVKAGAIPFVRDQGGQVEIVGQQHQDLLFDNESDAVDKITAVLADPKRQRQLIDSLEIQRYLFSTDRFMNEIGHVVDHCLTNVETASSYALGQYS